MQRLTDIVLKLAGRLGCLIGVHDDELVEADYGFGAAGNTATWQCRRCGRLRTRSE